MLAHHTVFQYFILPFCLFIGWIFLLLVSLSTPIIHSLPIFTVNADVEAKLLSSGAHGAISFGLWGYCTTGFDVSLFGHTDDLAKSGCSPAHAGYHFDNKILQAIGIESTLNLISTVLSVIFAITPAACALAFVALIASLLNIPRVHMRLFQRKGAAPGLLRQHSLRRLVSTTSGVAAALSLILWAVDYAKIKTAEGLARELTDGKLTFSFGSALWLLLVSWIFLWIASIGSCWLIPADQKRGHVPESPDLEKHQQGNR